MTFLCLPVKSLVRAKERLDHYLSQDDRQALARAMFEDVLLEARKVRGVDKLVVVSNDAQVLIVAAGAGALVMVEREQLSHAASADWAVAECMKRGATTVMLIPMDVPLVRAEEMESLLEKSRSISPPSLVIVPSRDGTGTNAMVRNPPDVIRSRFGPNSFPDHLAQAKARGARVEVMRPGGMVLDIDEPADISLFLAENPSGRAADLLNEIRGRKSQSA